MQPANPWLRAQKSIPVGADKPVRRRLSARDTREVGRPEAETSKEGAAINEEFRISLPGDVGIIGHLFHQLSTVNP